MGIQRVIHIRGPFAPFGPGGPGIHRMMLFGPGGTGIVRFIVMFGFLLVLALLAYLVIRHFDHNQVHHHNHVGTMSTATSTDSAAADVLKMRFAKGEIDEDEFTRRMTLLKDHQTTS
jgi:putative membrane protein